MSHYLVQDEPAYLLESRAYRETSLLVTLFTLNFGIVRLIVKGARSKKSSLHSQLQQGVPITVSWTGKNELKHLTHVDVADHDASKIALLPGEYQYALFYANELILFFLKDAESSVILFNTYCQLIASLIEKEALASSIRRFEFGLLEELGFAIDLETDCVTGKRVEAQGWYRLEGVQGVIQVAPGSKSSSGIQGQVLLNLSVKNFDDETSRQAKYLTRQLIDWHLEGHPLKSRDLFKRMKELQNGS